MVFRYPSSAAIRESADASGTGYSRGTSGTRGNFRSGCSHRTGRVIRPGAAVAGIVAPTGGPRSLAVRSHRAGRVARPGGAVGGVVPPTGGPRRVRFRGGGGLFPGPVHGTGRHELQVVQGPREFLHRAGEIRRLPEVPQGGVPGRRRRHLPDQRQGRVHALNTGHTGGPRRSDAPARVLNGDEIPHGFHETHTSGELRQNNAGHRRAQTWAKFIPPARPIRSAICAPGWPNVAAPHPCRNHARARASPAPQTAPAIHPAPGVHAAPRSHAAPRERRTRATPHAAPRAPHPASGSRPARVRPRPPPPHHPAQPDQQPPSGPRPVCN